MIILYPLKNTSLGLPDFQTTSTETKEQKLLNIHLIEPKNAQTNETTIAEAKLASPSQPLQQKEQTDSFKQWLSAKANNSALFHIPGINSPLAIPQTKDAQNNQDTPPFPYANAPSMSTPSLANSLDSIQQENFEKGLGNQEEASANVTHVFSKLAQAQIQAAMKAQQDYEAAQVEEEEYAITEDSDGTRYVNIKGVCWRIPPPDSDEAWTIVYAGCAGQTKTFNLEINIGLDVLGPDSPIPLD